MDSQLETEWDFPTVEQEVLLYQDPNLQGITEQKLLNGELLLACNQDSLIAYSVSERSKVLTLFHTMCLNGKEVDQDEILRYLKKEGYTFGCSTILSVVGADDTVQVLVPSL